MDAFKSIGPGSQPGSMMYRNDTFTVTRNAPMHYDGCPAEIIVLSFSRLDRGHSVDWRQKQEIKNAIVGKQYEAVELFPAESRLVDSANQFWLWCLDGKMQFPFGFAERFVSDTEEYGSAQRPGSGATEADETFAAGKMAEQPVETLFPPKAIALFKADRLTAAWMLRRINGWADVFAARWGTA